MHVFSDMADDVYIDETLEDELEDDEDVEIVEVHADDGDNLLLEKAKSPVWEHFGFKAKDGQFVEKDKRKRTTVYCTLCKILYRTKGIRRI